MTQVLASSEFQSKVLEAQGPVLVDFFATWCGPCKMMAPVVDQIADEVTGQASVYKIDIDQSADIASRYNVMSVPTFMVFNQGSVTNSTVGAQPKSVLLGLLSK